MWDGNPENLSHVVLRCVIFYKELIHLSRNLSIPEVVLGLCSNCIAFVEQMSLNLYSEFSCCVICLGFAWLLPTKKIDRVSRKYCAVVLFIDDYGTLQSATLSIITTFRAKERAKRFPLLTAKMLRDHLFNCDNTYKLKPVWGLLKCLKWLTNTNRDKVTFIQNTFSWF